jgi:hypothetical protein
VPEISKRNDLTASVLIARRDTSAYRHNCAIDRFFDNDGNNDEIIISALPSLVISVVLRNLARNAISIRVRASSPTAF